SNKSRLVVFGPMFDLFLFVLRINAIPIPPKLILSVLIKSHLQHRPYVGQWLTLDKYKCSIGKYTMQVAQARRTGNFKTQPFPVLVFDHIREKGTNLFSLLVLLFFRYRNPRANFRSVMLFQKRYDSAGLKIYLLKRGTSFNWSFCPL